MTRRKTKSKAKPHAVIVPLYPFDPEKSEIATLTENEVILTSHCLAPRVRRIVLIGADVKYHFTANDSDMNRFKHLFRRFVIDKNIYTLDEARPLDFFQLLRVLRREVQREEDRINSQWKEGLRDILSKARLHKEHWRSRIREAIERIEKYDAALHKGEPAGQSPMPYMSFDDYKSFRLPSDDDLPWMYWVLGWAIESVFGIDDVFIPKDAEERMQTLIKTAGVIDYEKYIFDYVRDVSLDDLRDYWSFVQADLEGLLPSESDTKTPDKNNSDITSKEVGGDDTSPQIIIAEPKRSEISQEDGKKHNYCKIAISKKEFGLILGLPDDRKIAKQINMLCKSEGIVLHKVTRESFLVAVDTLNPSEKHRFEEYMKNIYKYKLTQTDPN